MALKYSRHFFFGTISVDRSRPKTQNFDSCIYPRSRQLYISKCAMHLRGFPCFHCPPMDLELKEFFAGFSSIRTTWANKRIRRLFIGIYVAVEII